MEQSVCLVRGNLSRWKLSETTETDFVTQSLRMQLTSPKSWQSVSNETKNKKPASRNYVTNWIQSKWSIKFNRQPEGVWFRGKIKLARRSRKKIKKHSQLMRLALLWAGLCRPKPFTYPLWLCLGVIKGCPLSKFVFGVGIHTDAPKSNGN
jgi:hypothetical protein